MARKASGGSGRQGSVVPATYVPDDVLMAVSEALKPLDRIAVEMEAKWGAGRLPRLVSPELAARFGSAQDKLNAAIRLNDADAVAQRAAVLIRGWKALDLAASEAGAEALPLRTVGVSCEGRKFVICWDRGDVNKVAAMSEKPENVVTVHELFTAWHAMRDRMLGIDAAKRTFPGAEVVRAALKPGGDDVPF